MPIPSLVGTATPDVDDRSPLPCHFSVDDVFDALIDVSDAGLRLFEHPFFAFLKRLHEEFGVPVDLYLFFQSVLNGRRRTLEDVTDAVGETLRQNPWLRLGPHALDYETAPYAQTSDEQIRVFDAIYGQLDRFAPGAARSPWVRLHYFSEAYELAPYFKTKGVSALLTTDKAVGSYRIPDPERERLKARGRVDYGGITLVRSHLRMENLVADGLELEGTKRAVDSALREHGLVVLLTHECEIQRADVREMTVAVLRHLAGTQRTR